MKGQKGDDETSLAKRAVAAHRGATRVRRFNDTVQFEPRSVSTFDMSSRLAAMVDDWAERRSVTRAEAIRRLVELGLNAKR